MRLIDADAMMETIKNHHYLLSEKRNSTDYGMFTIGIQQAVDEQPTIDPVHAAGACYCRECKWTEKCMHHKEEEGGIFGPDDFCGYGEPKEETNDR